MSIFFGMLVQMFVCDALTFNYDTSTMEHLFNNSIVLNMINVADVEQLTEWSYHFRMALKSSLECVLFILKLISYETCHVSGKCIFIFHRTDSKPTHGIGMKFMPKIR